MLGEGEGITIKTQNGGEGGGGQYTKDAEMGKESENGMIP